MKISGNTVLITGGATGIGYSLAESFVKNGNEVIICGRRANRLQEAKQKQPQLHIKVCDVAQETERESLYNWVSGNFSQLNILVNNAGVQRPVNFKNGIEPLLKGENEIETNLTSPIYLSARFVPFLMKQPSSAIINISSSSGFEPLPHIPVYCITKAAIHAFSTVLRKQLKDTTIKVFEIVPPLVDTELFKGGEGRKLPFKGIPPSSLAEKILNAVETDEEEILVGEAFRLVTEGKLHIEQMLQHQK